MPPVPLNEAVVEAQLLAHLRGLGWAIAHGREIAAGAPHVPEGPCSGRERNRANTRFAPTAGAGQRTGQ